jgi:hypothetical protein
VIHLPVNTGFAGGVAQALERVSTPYVALLNNDAAADPEWLATSIARLGADPRIGAVTARMLLWPQDGGLSPAPAVINNAGVILTPTLYGADRGSGAPDGPPFDSACEVFGVSGGACVLRTEAVKRVGGIPSRFFLYYEDTDLSWRLRLAGWQCWYEPAAVVRHRHAASTDRNSERFAFYNERNRLLMLLRCAPVDVAVAATVRFGLTSGSLVIKRLLGRRVPQAWVFRGRLRMRVIAGVATSTPWALRTRKEIGAQVVLSRTSVADEWVGRSGEAMLSRP